MSKYEEALSSILFTMHYRVKPKKLGYCEDENFKILQELVDKATPKKVKNIENHYLFETYELDHTSGNCPNCNKGVSCDEYYQIEFCPDCGQKLDWNE